MFIYLYLHFSKCMLHQFAILFTVMWLCNFEAVAAGEDWSKSSCFLGGGGGGAAWKPAKQVLVGKLKEQGGRAVSSELCYRVLTGTRARMLKLRKTMVIFEFPTLKLVYKSRSTLLKIFFYLFYRLFFIFCIRYVLCRFFKVTLHKKDL